MKVLISGISSSLGKATAIKLLEGLWDRAPDSWSGLTIAWCLDYLGRREEAIQWYARVAVMPFLSETQRRAAADGVESPKTPKAAPTPLKGLEFLATVKARIRDGEFAAAVEQIDAHLKKASPRGEYKQRLWYLKALALFNQSDMKGAVAALRTALEAAPDSGRAGHIRPILNRLEAEER